VAGLCAHTHTHAHVRTLLLQVGPGEVDEELEEEVGVECTKYGEVKDVMIFEITAPNYPSEEAVRIFVQVRIICIVPGWVVRAQSLSSA